MKSLRKYIRRILIESTLPANLEIAPSEISGDGIFAIENIPSGTNLGVSHVQTSDGYDITELGCYHNHAYNPNCINKLTNGVRYLYTTQPISAGEEITVDYTKQPDLEQPESHWV